MAQLGRRQHGSLCQLSLPAAMSQGSRLALPSCVRASNNITGLKPDLVELQEVPLGFLLALVEIWLSDVPSCVLGPRARLWCRGCSRGERLWTVGRRGGWWGGWEGMAEFSPHPGFPGASAAGYL